MTLTHTDFVFMFIVALAFILVVLPGCDIQRENSLRQCMDHCSGPDCFQACGDAVAKAYGNDKENEHVFRWDHGRKAP